MYEDSHVCFVDDDEDIRESFGELTESVGLRSSLFGDPQEFLSEYAAEERGCGCIVLDVRMQGMSGLEVLRQLRDRGIKTPVIVMTGHAEVDTAVEMTKMGAVDFLQKPVSDQMLLELIHRVLAAEGTRKSLESEKQKMIDRLKRLTGREREILDYVIRGKTSKETARSLSLSPKTIEFHRHNIMKKLRARSVVDLGRISTDAAFTGINTESRSC